MRGIQKQSRNPPVKNQSSICQEAGQGRLLDETTHGLIFIHGAQLCNKGILFSTTAGLKGKEGTLQLSELSLAFPFPS